MTENSYCQKKDKPVYKYGFELNNSILIQPDSILLTGPKSTLDTISYISTSLLQKKELNVSINEFVAIKEFNPDVLHLSGLQGSGFHAVLAARLCGKRSILLTVHGSSIDAINISKNKKFIFGKFF